VVGALARLGRVARPKPLHVVVKSVHCAFSVDWLAERYRPEVVVVRRNPLNVVASFHRFRPQTEHMPELDAVFLHPVVQADVVRPSGIPAPPTEGTPLERLAWRVGLEQAAFDVALARHSTWVAVDHDRLCENPEERFRQLFARLRLPWDPAVERFLDQSNRPSQEFFGTDRVTAGQPRAWRTSFTPSELDQVTRILGAFPGQGELSRLEKPSSPIGLVHVTSEPVDAGAE